MQPTIEPWTLGVLFSITRQWPYPRSSMCSESNWPSKRATLPVGYSDGPSSALKPDIVFNTLVGQSVCHVLAAFAALGLDDHTAIASHNVTGAEMLAMSTPPAAGHVT